MSINKNLYQSIQSNNTTVAHNIIFTHLINESSLTFYNDKIMKDKGFISLILQYAILVNNTDLIEMIFPFLSMKRDYYNLMNYYSSNKDVCIKLFINYILPKDDFISSDIEFLIESDFTYLLPYLANKFITVNFIGDKPDTTLYKLPFDNQLEYIDKIKNKIDSKKFSHFNNFLKHNKFNYIIDAGNILFSRSGNINKDSIKDLDTVLKIFPDSIVIIHTRHLKNESIKNILQKSIYYQTPINHYDDIFIILCFIISQKPIITNDNYKDFYIDDKYLKGHINDNLVKYDNNKGLFTFIMNNDYSRCIQIKDDYVYIPALDNSIIKVKIKN
jgi:hypothetical protein